MKGSTTRVLAALGAAVFVMGIAGPAQAQRRGGFNQASVTGLLRFEEVRTELKLDPAQSELVQGYIESTQGRREELQGLQREERAAKEAAFEATDQAKINEILNEAQEKRLAELLIQRAGSQALARKDVQDKLSLSAEQRQQITTIETEIAAKQREARQDGGGGREAFQAINMERETRLLAVLTAAQKTSFEGLKGAAFEFPQRRGRGNN